MQARLKKHLPKTCRFFYFLLPILVCRVPRSSRMSREW
jgi:hypothetical protein